ncbi:MAG: hypothetical protein ACAI43_15475 [Phycisphaerae bacterium]|nr:hypothetical protein [Tepidisphaeraceae bacterium]
MNRLALLAVASLALAPALAARAETAAAAPDAPQVRYVEYGQARYAVAVPVAARPAVVNRPYALTGALEVRETGFWDRNQALRYISGGQGRWVVPFEPR